MFFRNVNRGKKSVVLDLKQDSDRETLLKLCETADVFVESFRPASSRVSAWTTNGEGPQSRASSIVRSARLAKTVLIFVDRRTTWRSKP